GVVSGLIRFLLLKVLNISMVGMIEKRSLKRKAFDRRQSNEKYLLSLRNELRLVAVRGPGPHGAVSVWPGVQGCALRAWIRALASKPHGNSPFRMKLNLWRMSRSESAELDFKLLGLKEGSVEGSGWVESASK